ncbi:UNVERIFIED_CONTAM: hypothetical protein PYX00_001552 [Menopon gallinae]|uniref:RRP12-like protein n=1 Tax=Menopon gallinae TaxID=328185 RepID=A0AAW2IFB4_9NEOP
MASLRRLIKRSEERPDKSDAQELARFAKNYLPLLFTLYTTKTEATDEGGERLAAFDTIKIYLNITSPEICAELFDRALKIMDDTTSDAFTKESVMDLLKLLIPYQNEDRLSAIYSKCINAIKKSKVKKDEKKAYRLLEVLIASDTPSCKKFMTEKTKELLTFILKSLKRNDVKYRGARLRCILHLLKYIPENQYNALKEIIPEAIICCRDINQRTRMFAFRLLEQMFVLCRKWSDKEEADIIRDYVNMIIGGLAGTPTLVSATVLALAKLTSTLRAELPPDVVQLLLESVCLLLALPTREIVGSALTYLKVFITAIQKPQLFAYLPAIVKAVISMVDDCRNHFRLKTRDVLDRLLRKFGYDTIKLLIPEDDTIMHKRLKNLRRIHLKKQAHKSESEDEDSAIGEFALKAKSKSIDDILASSDEESDDEEEKAEKKWNDKGQSYIEEDPDNIVDFLTPTATGKITAAKPVVKKKKERDVKMSSDGRLIIMDEKVEKSECASEMDDIESMMSEVVIGKKRKLSTSSDGASKYQAGGTGIHRPTKAPKLENSKKAKKEKTKPGKKGLPTFKTGKEYRAKKARGDVKLKGKPDPYAYIPLSRKLLNKRKRQKSSAQFKGVVQAALKGARKGSKAKMRKQK